MESGLLLKRGRVGQYRVGFLRGFVSAAGGKWTTYRRMAADALNTACSRGRLGVCGPCRTAHLKVLAAASFRLLARPGS